MSYLPYEEPDITTLLSLTSFLLLLNGFRYVLDRLIYCGIIGEIFVGIIWGLPVGGTAWLSKGTQEAIQAFGYLGLVGLVFEGGLATDIAELRKNAYVSFSVATVGLLSPIALSFLLLVFPFSDSTGGTAYPTPLAAFSAGASLCSTSLGTTFAILSAANMEQTRVGMILVGAAMMDDIVGLVMVNIVTTLGTDGNGGWPIARPIAASFGLLLINLALCPYVLKPIWRWLLGVLKSSTHLDAQQSSETSKWTTIMKMISQTPSLAFIISTLFLIAFVAIAWFIDASVLFAAFMAGGDVRFLWNAIDEEHLSETTPHSEGASKMYRENLKPIMDCIFIPFFFASIGFSIPITNMFKGSTIWKGMLYAILMILAKGMISAVFYLEYFIKQWKAQKPILRRTRRNQASQTELVHLSMNALQGSSDVCSPDTGKPTPPHSTALLAGLAMVARGEIGFLIASLSESSGILALQRDGKMITEPVDEDMFLVIVWAVVLCTLVGPVGVGITIRRMRA